VNTPALGRPFAAVPPYLRHELGSHVVFFQREANGGVVIVRVLRKRMLLEVHLEPSQDDPDKGE
jgi:plasmid stabilization system protein ParE